MASASLARAGFLRSGSYQPRNMASSCGVSPLHPVRRFDAVMIPEHTFFFEQVVAYVRSTEGVSLRSGVPAAPQGESPSSPEVKEEEGIPFLDSSTPRLLDYGLPCRLAVSVVDNRGEKWG